jgi:parallel beta-helix repeat protein
MRVARSSPRSTRLVVSLSSSVALVALTALSACGGGGSGGGGASCGAAPSGCDVLVCPALSTSEVQTALIEVGEGQTLCFAAGTYTLDAELSLDVPNVTLRGADADPLATLLDFSGQATGANGISITSDGVVVRDLAVRDTPGDGVRAQGVVGITFDNVYVDWTAEASVDNGAYGLYPVESENVRIERCVVKGARDAGIYVGQSRKILVKDSEAMGNVAGIEIENSTDAEVVGNHAHDNTGGVLVFNLPGLPMKESARCKVHDNLIENNNGPNFASGGAVAGVPVGLGLMLLATDDNEIHNNTITGNHTTGIALISHASILVESYSDEAFDAVPAGNYVHDNVFEQNGTDPDPDIALLVGAGSGPVTDIVWDGILALDVPGQCPAAPPAMAPATNCFQANGAATYTNVNLCGDLAADQMQLDDVDCSYPSLSTQDP